MSDGGWLTLVKRSDARNGVFKQIDSTGLQAHPGRWQLCEETQHLLPSQSLAQHWAFDRINPMQLETLLDVSTPMRIIWLTDGSLV